MKKDFISIKDLSSEEVVRILRLSDTLRNNRQKYCRSLAGKTLALIFQKPSNRTRVSFEVGMHQLGGQALYLSPNEINLGVREAVCDVARTLSRYVDGIVIRTFEHRNVLELAQFSGVPVINGLSDFSHPCQALADIYTVLKKFKTFKGITLAYIGDGNNVCNSLIFASAKVGLNLAIATPPGYEPDKKVIEEGKKIAAAHKSKITLGNDPKIAVSKAHVIYTDVWTSMGQEQETQKRNNDFNGFQINSALVGLADARAVVMHCLPAHRGQEITDEVIDGKQSVVFDQAENRLHVQKAVLYSLMHKLKA